MLTGTPTTSSTLAQLVDAFLDAADDTNSAGAVASPRLGPWGDTPHPEDLRQGHPARLVGFFPGLGSRAAYHHLGRSFLDSGIDEIATIYAEAARALGFPEAPERLLGDPRDLPENRLERQGHIGALVLTHSLVLEAHLRAMAKERGAAVTFRAYTGESFGILTAAVASRSLSVADGVRFARAFTPLSLMAAEGIRDGEPIATELAAFLPDSVAGRRLVPEPFHVLGLKGEPTVLRVAIEALGREFSAQDVEVHKRYSPTQTNLYVRGALRESFDKVLDTFDGVEASELKEPTTFLAHSRRLGAVRTALERFLDAKGIDVRTPQVPVIANHRHGVLTTAGEVREGILAMTDVVMDSQATVEVLDSLHVDATVELGPGEKSVRLLRDGNVRTPAIGYTGTTEEALSLVRTVAGVSGLKRELERIRPAGDHLEAQHLEMVRALVSSIADDSFGTAYTVRAVGRIVTREMLGPEPRPHGSRAYHRLLAAFQNTWRYRDRIDAGAGELVLRARPKKRTDTWAPVGETYVELRTVNTDGIPRDLRIEHVGDPEVVVLRFDCMPGIDTDALHRQVQDMVADHPLARMVWEHLHETREGSALTPTEAEAVDRITYHVALFHLMRLHRPTVLAQRGRYVQGADPLGWLAALTVSGTADPADILELYGLHLTGVVDRGILHDALNRLAPLLRDADIPVLAPDGVPLHAKRDIASAIRAVVLDGALAAGPSAAHVGGGTLTVSFGPTGPAHGTTPGSITLRSHLDVSKRGVNDLLDAFEDSSTLQLGIERREVLRYALERRILPTTVNAYLKPDEQAVGFGKGGSESMTVFLVKDGDTRTLVRKVLSEALVTAAWRADGTGVMLAPFAKAGEQADFLRHLPAPVNEYFPEVYGVVEREIPAPQGTGERATHNEVIYEMSFVEGDEVSRYVERYSPPPAVVAKLYREIYRVLEHEIHTVNRVRAPGGTLDESHLTKIEDRLDLSRRTAPHTFGPHLLEPEHITINGVRYRNAQAAVRWFREHPEHHRVLEPRFHSLVMGDTNTENIKVTRSGPLWLAQKLIEKGAPQREIDAALAAITAETLGIKFLDPRAIGFNSSGRNTVDDPMYDNKPWHNSIGHYDEMHFEHFEIDVRASAGAEPVVRIRFHEGNPFQRAYRVRDVVEHDRAINSDDPAGMEDHFALVMSEALALDRPDSPTLVDDPYWLVRFVFMMGTHFVAMPPFHFQAELDGSLTDTYQVQRRPVAIYCEGIKWLNWTIDILEGRRTSFLGVPVPKLR